MDATTINELAVVLRDSCLADPSKPDLAALDAILEAARSPSRDLAVVAARSLIRSVVEELSDRFSPRLTECYVDVFTRAISAIVPSFSAKFLRERYADLRALPSRAVSSRVPESIIVPSRITLGSDIAVTSIFLQALRTRFPSASLWFAGPAKNFELFAGMPNLRHWPLTYPSGGTLAERFGVVHQFSDVFDTPDMWWMDPDSRISQLGLLPVAPLGSSLFFESRSAAPDSVETLSALASHWCEGHLGTHEIMPAMALPPSAEDSLGAAVSPQDISLSLGVGNNPDKRVSAEFEAQILQSLADTGRRIWIDSGSGGEEAAMVSAAVAAVNIPPGSIRVLNGSFSDFCRIIQRTSLYIGYDSAGQHAAAALGVPSITLFKGFANERMLRRWSPRGTATARVIPILPQTSEADILRQFNAILKSAL
ncbi:MAG: hypothetical protein LC114_25245 [Bryobacterales bacterium]|nr:hypothetical protein [Bryobacterales bacterium]